MIETWLSGMPRRSEMICTVVVSRLWPWLWVPVSNSIVPRISADSHGTPAPRLPTAVYGAAAGLDAAGHADAAKLAARLWFGLRTRKAA